MESDPELMSPGDQGYRSIIADNEERQKVEESGVREVLSWVLKLWYPSPLKTCKN